MYFRRPSFRKGGGINQLTPRVRAQEGYFGNTPIYPIPLNQCNFLLNNFQSLILKK